MAELNPPEHPTDEEELVDLYDADEISEVLPFRYSISSYGADYPIDGLVKRIKNGDILIPSFQRGYVWPLPKASRFVESLLLGLPVPSIFLSKETMTNKLLVIDGQQRLKTLQYFYQGFIPQTEKQFKLAGLASQYCDIAYGDLADEDRRHLDDSIMHAIIVRQEKPSDDDSSIYHVFERLNTGGVLLAPQEIRACIYHGPFNSLLGKLNEDLHWRALFGPVNKRMRDQELILRFFALYFQHDRYASPMKEFLNTFMSANRKLKRFPEKKLVPLFQKTIATAHDALGERAFRPVRTLNAAVFDAVMVGLARRLRRSPPPSKSQLRDEYEALAEAKDFEKATSVGTTQEANVRQRIALATDAFEEAQ